MTAQPASRVVARLKEHESGRQQILFFPFVPEAATERAIEGHIASARTEFGGDIKLLRIRLSAEQTAVRAQLKAMGFVVDGYEFGVAPLVIRSWHRDTGLPQELAVRRLDYDADIDAPTAMEKAIHAADPSSRVSFEDEQARRSMQRHYKRASETGSVFVMVQSEQLVGVLGFMTDKTRDKALHVSTAGIATQLQGRGLFMPFLATALEQLDLGDTDLVTWVTTTDRLLGLLARRGVSPLGCSLIREDALQPS